MKTIEGDLTIKNKKIALIAGRFNSFVVEHLISGAKGALLKHGADDSDIDLLYVPGAFEIPLALPGISKFISVTFKLSELNFKIKSMISSFSSMLYVQVEYTIVPPGFNAL